MIDFIEFSKQNRKTQVYGENFLKSMCCIKTTLSKDYLPLCR